MSYAAVYREAVRESLRFRLNQALEEIYTATHVAVYKPDSKIYAYGSAADAEATALEMIGVYGLRAVDIPAVKAIAREFPFQVAAERGHNLARQGSSCECTQCPASGSVVDTEAGLKLKGAIFTTQCDQAYTARNPL